MDCFQKIKFILILLWKADIHFPIITIAIFILQLLNFNCYFIIINFVTDFNLCQYYWRYYYFVHFISETIFFASL